MGMLCFELRQVSVSMNMQQGAKYEVRVYCACISYAWARCYCVGSFTSLLTGKWEIRCSEKIRSEFVVLYSSLIIICVISWRGKLLVNL